MPHIRGHASHAELLFALLIIATAAVIPCRPSHDAILVFAAASLSNVLTEVADDFTAREGVPVRISFGGSNALAQQLRRGAQADVFISAGAGPMDALAAEGHLLPDSRASLLSNRLVLVGPAAASDETGLGVLRSVPAQRLAIADPQFAPAGEYARAALQSLGLWEQVLPSLVVALDVRTVVIYVEQGNADLGIVYRTDVVGRDRLGVLAPFPAGSHPDIAYPAAVLRDSARPQAARDFIAFLGSSPIQSTFQERGWDPAPVS